MAYWILQGTWFSLSREGAVDRPVIAVKSCAFNHHNNIVGHHHQRLCSTSVVRPTWTAETPGLSDCYSDFNVRCFLLLLRGSTAPMVEVLSGMCGQKSA